MKILFSFRKYADMLSKDEPIAILSCIDALRFYGCLHHGRVWIV